MQQDMHGPRGSYKKYLGNFRMPDNERYWQTFVPISGSVYTSRPQLQAVSLDLASGLRVISIAIISGAVVTAELWEGGIVTHFN
jgi:hypothetical protein